MCEKLIKCAAKTGFEIQSYIPRTHEMTNRILSKNKGCLFFLVPKIYQLPEYYNVIMFARKYFFLPNLGGSALLSPSPTPMMWNPVMNFRLGPGTRFWLLVATVNRCVFIIISSTADKRFASDAVSGVPATRCTVLQQGKTSASRKARTTGVLHRCRR